MTDQTKISELESKVAELKTALLLATNVAVRCRILLASPIENLSANAASLVDALNDYEGSVVEQAKQKIST